MHMWERLHVAAAANSCRVHALDPCGCMPVAPWAALLGLLEESCEREVLRPRMGENRLMPVCSAEKLNHSAPCCSVRLLVWFFLGAHKKKKKKDPCTSCGKGTLSRQHPFCTAGNFLWWLLLEGKRRDTAWLLHSSDMRERSLQPSTLSGPTARALFLPRQCADQPEADGNRIRPSKALFSSHWRIFADLLSHLRSKVVF